MSKSTFSLISLPVGFFVTALLTYFLIRVGLRYGVLDIPNDRSSHASPVPRGGGLSVVVAFLIFCFVYPTLFDGAIDNSVWISLTVGGVMIAVLGGLDDIKHITAPLRFLVHLVAAVLSLVIMRSLPEITVFGAILNLGVLGYVFFAVALVWFINLFNFMDGIDGIAGIEAVTTLGGGALIMFCQGQLQWLPLFGYLMACVAGFLIWNWPPARVFMGDACSGFLGFTLGVLIIATSLDGAMNLWVWLILCGVFLVDATTTLVRRVIRGDRWYEAHRTHAYQILAQRLRSHSKVSIFVILINVFWLLPLGFMAALNPYWAMPVCFFALLPLLVLVIRIGSNVGDERHIAGISGRG